MFACVWTEADWLGWRIVYGTAQQSKTLGGSSYGGYSHRPKSIPVELDVPHIIRRMDDLPCAHEGVVEHVWNDLSEENARPWAIVREWRSRSGRAVHQGRIPETGEDVWVLYRVCLDPLFSSRFRLPEWIRWFVGADEPLLVRGERQIKRYRAAGGGVIAYLTVVCPVHHKEVCRVDVPGEWNDATAWLVFGEVMRMAAQEYDQVGTPWKAGKLCVKCPRGHHPVEIPVNVAKE